MKKKKILNIRNSLITYSLVLTTILTGCGLLKGDRSNQNQSGNSSSSQTIIDDEHNNTNELPGGIVVNPVTPTPGEKDQTTKDPVINSEKQEQKPGTVTPSNPTDGNTYIGVTPVEPTNPTVTTPETEHKHTLGEWVVIDDLFEGSYCPEDGTLMLTRTHDYKVTDIKIIDTLDGFSHDTTITETCTTCGHEKSTTYSREGHTYGEITWDETNEYETCKDCGHVHTIGKHKFDNGKVQGNEKIYSCENEGCGYTYSKPYTPGHTTGGGSHGGGSSTDRPSHTHYYGEWKSLNDELEYTVCSSCGETITREHKYNTISTNITSNKNGTHTTIITEKCVNCNHTKTTEVTNDCNYVKNETYKSTDDKHHNHTIEEVCNVCKDSKTLLSETESCNFTLTSSVTETNGDITETYTCDNNCGNTYTKNIPYNPGHTHIWGEWTTTKAPTCTEAGEETRKCTASGCSSTETRTIAALGHKEETIPGKRATCTEAGLTDGAKCSVCGEITKEQETIDALGHKEGPKNPTSGEVRCSTCGTLLRVELVDDEIWSEWTTTKSPTCTEAGEETRTCTVNGVVTDTETRTIAALGHKEETIPGKRATCTEAGLTDGAKCSVCGEITKEQETIDALGHKEGTKNPTSGEVRCSTCGTLLRVELVDDEEVVEDNAVDVEDQTINKIIETQDKAKDTASAEADKKLNDLLNSDADEDEMDAALDEIIKDQELANANADANADKQLDEAITNIENAEAMDAGKDEAQAIIEAGNKEVEQAIEAGSKEVDEVMERSAAELQARMEQADAELAAILANSPLQRIRKLF